MKWLAIGLLAPWMAWGCATVADPNLQDFDADGDGHIDAIDAFPNDPNEWADPDKDGIGSNADTDNDNDLCLDTADVFPLDPTECLDTDHDGVGDKADADDDNDSVLDTVDCDAKNDKATIDTDTDGSCNENDDDDDADGFLDSVDKFPLDATESLDGDADGIGDTADTDDDNDGVADATDCAPKNKDETADADRDGTCDVADTDDDNDGVPDTSDAFPTNAAESADNDADGIGNNSDAFPNDKTEWTDADGDGVGNNADCSDSSAAVRPTAIEVCGDSTDNNCDSTDDSLGCFLLVDVAVAGDAFTMGAADAAADPPNDTQHVVTINTDYYMHKYEVTNTLYKRCVTAGTCTAPNPSIYYSDASRGNQPVVNVTWNDANTYCTHINARLPSEAEWELAARGTGNRTYPWGAAAPTATLANYNSGEFVGDLVDVDQQSTGQTTLGIFQMGGNVFEWVNDWSAAYGAGAATNPTGPTAGTEKIYRGGSFQSAVGDLEAADRFDATQTSRASSLGFRCADN